MKIRVKLRNPDLLDLGRKKKLAHKDWLPWRDYANYSRSQRTKNSKRSD